MFSRWAAVSEDPLPESFPNTSKFTTQAIEIRQKDPQLVEILEGTCNAGLKADVLEGKFEPVAPSIEQRQQEAMASKPSVCMRPSRSKPATSPIKCDFGC